jgi:predicted NAD/FAD-binding protein
LYEREPRLGGHTHTIVVDDETGPQPLDTGFLVHNDRTYPNLVRLFAEIGVETQPSDMSFSVSCQATGLEYSSRGVRGFFAQRRRFASLSQYRLLRDILRFNREAPAVLALGGAESWTLKDYLDRQGYGDEFAERYLVPMASAIWSTSFAGIHAFPIQTLVRFMQNHGMLSVGAHPVWRVLTGGSHLYIPRLTAPLQDRIHTGVRLAQIERTESRVTLQFLDRPPQDVDEVVLACHGDQVLPLLASPTATERDVFQHFTTIANETWLHRDARFLPARPWARASWNYRLGVDRASPPSVTYHLNRLQGLACRTTYCVTLNPTTDVAPDAVIRRLTYRHPRYTVASVAAQARWHEVSGVNRTHFCGAYWRYGFHEDGLLSALRVAATLGVHW